MQQTFVMQSKRGKVNTYKLQLIYNQNKTQLKHFKSRAKTRNKIIFDFLINKHLFPVYWKADACQQCIKKRVLMTCSYSCRYKHNTLMQLYPKLLGRFPKQNLQMIVQFFYIYLLTWNQLSKCLCNNQFLIIYTYSIIQRQMKTCIYFKAQLVYLEVEHVMTFRQNPVHVDRYV